MMSNLTMPGGTLPQTRCPAKRYTARPVHEDRGAGPPTWPAQVVLPSQRLVDGAPCWAEPSRRHAALSPRGACALHPPNPKSLPRAPLHRHIPHPHRVLPPPSVPVPQVCDLYLTHLTLFQKIAVFYGTLNHFVVLYVADVSVVLFTAMWVLFAVAQIGPNILASHGAPIGVPWLIPLGILNMIPMLVERTLEYTYLSLTDCIFSIPFYSHQNRITADSFRNSLTTKKVPPCVAWEGAGVCRSHEQHQRPHH